MVLLGFSFSLSCAASCTQARYWATFQSKFSPQLKGRGLVLAHLPCCRYSHCAFSCTDLSVLVSPPPPPSWPRRHKKYKLWPCSVATTTTRGQQPHGTISCHSAEPCKDTAPRGHLRSNECSRSSSLEAGSRKIRFRTGGIALNW